jgi:hypothetical protein
MAVSLDGITEILNVSVIANQFLACGDDPLEGAHSSSRYLESFLSSRWSVSDPPCHLWRNLLDVAMYEQDGELNDTSVRRRDIVNMSCERLSLNRRRMEAQYYRVSSEVTFVLCLATVRMQETLTPEHAINSCLVPLAQDCSVTCECRQLEQCKKAT